MKHFLWFTDLIGGSGVPQQFIYVAAVCILELGKICAHSRLGEQPTHPVTTIFGRGGVGCRNQGMQKKNRKRRMNAKKWSPELRGQVGFAARIFWHSPSLFYAWDTAVRSGVGPVRGRRRCGHRPKLLIKFLCLVFAVGCCPFGQNLGNFSPFSRGGRGRKAAH